MKHEEGFHCMQLGQVCIILERTRRVSAAKLLFLFVGMQSNWSVEQISQIEWTPGLACSDQKPCKPAGASLLTLLALAAPPLRARSVPSFWRRPVCHFLPSLAAAAQEAASALAHPALPAGADSAVCQVSAELDQQHFASFPVTGQALCPVCV